MTTPYTYRIFSKSTNKYYYGVRYARNCHPADLFVKYFTSSKVVKELIIEYGKEDFIIEIRKIFESKIEACEWELRVNKWTVRWDNYLNKYAPGGSFKLTDEERRKIGIKSGNKCRDLKLGFHTLTHDEKSLIGKKSDETNKKNKTGIYSITKEEARKIGRKCFKLGLGLHSKEAKKKQKETAKKPWWNNGIVDKKSNECPGNEWVKGRMTKGKRWWNNSIEEIMSIEKPDDTWIKGRLK